MDQDKARQSTEIGHVQQVDLFCDINVSLIGTDLRPLKFLLSRPFFYFVLIHTKNSINFCVDSDSE